MLVIALPARFPLRLLLALVLGALHAASFIDDATWPLEIATLAGLAALSARAAREIDGPRGTRRAAAGGARVGFAFGLGWFTVGVSWIYISLHTYGELAAPLAAAAVLAFCAYLSIYPALACAGFAAFRHWRGAAERSGIASALMFGALWGASEIARGFVFTGFPWLAAGYAHVGSPLAGYAPVIGVYGISTIAALIAAAIAGVARPSPNARRRDGRMLLLLVVGLVVPLVGAGLERVEWTRPVGKPIAVRLLQGNIAQDVKFLSETFTTTIDAYLAAVEAKRADLIVLPETAIPVFLDELPEAVGQRIAHDAQTMSTDIAFGIPIEEPGDRYFNSVLAVGPSSDGRGTQALDPEQPTGIVAQRYDKSHLVPFGEFVPTGFHWFVRMLNIPLGDFTRGSTTQEPMTLAGLRVAFNVCYEDLFGEEIIRQAGTANVLINVSNVAWFGDSMALPQHLDISRMRSLETRRPMLRATNTGMTASIDPHGRVLAVLKPFTVGSLDVDVQGTTGSTPFVRFGNAPAMLLIVLLAVAAIVVTRDARRVRR